MSKHRRDEDDPTMLPETVEQLAAKERASRPSLRRTLLHAIAPPRLHPRLQSVLGRVPRRYAVPAALAAIVLLVCTGWALTQPANVVEMLTPSTTANGKSNRVVEGFGEAASPTPSPPQRSNPRPAASPSRSPLAVASAPAPAALAIYQFNEANGATATDVSGNGRTATLSGGASFVAGRTGNGVNLGGTTQYVALPSGILNGAKDFTVSVWVRLDSVSNWSRLFDFGSGTDVNMFLTPRTSAGTARFAITTGGSGAEQRITAPTALPSGAWTHVAVTLSAGTGILYLNRVEVARTTGITISPASMGNMTNNWVGRSQYRADPYLDGIVDDLRIYSRALSAGEIAALP